MASAARKSILEMGSDDDYGLYEIVWSLRTSWPDASDGAIRVAAIEALTALLKERKVAIHSGISERPNADSLPLAEALTVVSDNESWRDPTRDGPVFWFGNLPAGEEEYFGRA